MNLEVADNFDSDRLFSALIDVCSFDVITLPFETTITYKTTNFGVSECSIRIYCAQLIDVGFF